MLQIGDVFTCKEFEQNIAYRVEFDEENPILLLDHMVVGGKTHVDYKYGRINADASDEKRGTANFVVRHIELDDWGDFRTVYAKRLDCFAWNPEGEEVVFQQSLRGGVSFAISPEKINHIGTMMQFLMFDNFKPNDQN